MCVPWKVLLGFYLECTSLHGGQSRVCNIPFPSISVVYLSIYSGLVLWPLVNVFFSSFVQLILSPSRYWSASNHWLSLVVHVLLCWLKWATNVCVFTQTTDPLHRLVGSRLRGSGCVLFHRWTFLGWRPPVLPKWRWLYGWGWGRCVLQCVSPLRRAGSGSHIHNRLVKLVPI